MTGHKQETKIRECFAVFTDANHLRASINDLLVAGFQRNQLGLLASEVAVRETLGDFDTEPEEFSQTSAITFVEEKGLAESGQSLGGGLFLIGTAGVGGAVISSAAVLGGSLLAAISAPVGVGIVALAVARVIHQDDADYLQQQVDEGRLLLFIRIGPADEDTVKTILENNKAIDTRVIEVPVSSKS